MRLPLFVHAAPQVGLSSSDVLVGAGRWEVSYNGKTTPIRLNFLDISAPTMDGHIISFPKDCRVMAVVESLGKESSITLFLKRIGANVPTPE
jgi:hypothetical protein